MKEGNMLIGDRTGQLRYSTATTDENVLGHINNDPHEQWLQQLSVYYAAEDIKRGQPVSPSLADDLTTPQLESALPFVSLTNTAKHKKCLGLAMEPAKAGQPFHILSTGRFVFDEITFTKLISGTDDTEYYPDFGYNIKSDEVTAGQGVRASMYRDLIGKQVFVKSRDALKYQGRDVKGELTVDEKETYYGNHNIIQVGFIADAPNKVGEHTLSLELQFEGDGRGPIDNTQWELLAGEQLLIGSNEQLKLLAIGQEEGSPFKCLVSCTAPVLDKDRVVLPSDFIALQRLDGKTVFITVDPSITSIDELRNAVVSNNNTEDMAFMNVAFNYANAYSKLHSSTDAIGLTNVLPISFDLGASETAYKTNVETIFKALKTAYTTISDSKSATGNTLKMLTTGIPVVTNEEDNVLSAYADIKAGENGGYFELYVSQHLKDTFLTGTELKDGGSTANKGRAIVADIRINTRQNIAGLYFNKAYDLDIPVGSNIIALHQGQFVIDTSTDEYDKDGALVKVNSPRLIPGATYYLGTNGNLVTTPIEWTDSVVKVGVAKDELTLLVDCDDCRIYDVGTLPIGYMKPSIAGHAEYGFVLMDGGESDVSNTITSITTADGTEVEHKNRYQVDKYPVFFKRLRSIYSDTELEYTEEPLTYTYVTGETEVISNTFIVPKACVWANGSEQLAQIKWLEEGTFAQIPRIPYIRTTGLLPDCKENEITAVTFDALDITKLVHYGPRENSVYNVELEDLDIHLYIDLNTFKKNSYPDWVEIPEGFKAFNNTSAYGFRWKLETYNEYGNDEDSVLKFENNQVKYKISPSLDTDDVHSMGIAYQLNPLQPPKLMYGYKYKVFVARHEYNNRKVDLDAVFTNSLANRVISPLTGKPTLDPVSGQAVFDYMNTNSNVDKFTVNKKLIIGDVDHDESATMDAYVSNAVIRGPVTFYNLDKSTFIKIDGNDISASASKEFDSWGAFKNEKADIQSIPTIGTLQSIFAKDWSTNEILGVTNNGYTGNISASKLDGLYLGTGPDAQVTANVSSGYIPYVDASHATGLGDKVTYNIESSAGFIPLKESFSWDSEASFNAGNRNVVKTFDIDADRKFKQVFNFSGAQQEGDNTYDMAFYVNDNPANIKAGVFTSGSSIKYKNLFNTQIRKYATDFDKEIVSNKEFTMVDVTNTVSGRLDSALQAAYELPLNVFSYKQNPTWFKKYIGLIIEQLNHITSDDGLTETVTRNITSDKTYGSAHHTDADTFTYTKNEITSIDTFIRMLTDDAEQGVNILSSVGMLFSAAKETQERLLKLEASTFGRDAETIPGDKEQITQEIEKALPDDDISQTPTYIGLNRIVRALCKEVFNTYDPQNAYDLSPTVGSYRARMEDLYLQIEGSNGGQNNLDNYKKGNVLNPLNNKSDWYTQSGYYKGTDEENDNDNERNIEAAAQRNTYPTDIKLEPTVNHDVNIPDVIDDQGEFNGLNDAVNRIIQKLNVLTAEVNGADNIKAGPVNLNIIRENVKKAICELYFNESYQDSLALFDNTQKSKMDLIQELLFQNSHVTNNAMKNYPTANRIPDNAETFKTYQNIIDLIVTTLGSEIVPLANTGMDNSLDNVTKRLYLPVADRLKNLESAMDKAINSLSGNESDYTYGNVVTAQCSVTKFVEEVSTFLGLSYYQGAWHYNETSTTNVTSDLVNHRNTFTVIKDIYSRVQALENTTSKVITNIIPGHYNRNQNMSADVDSLLTTVYGTTSVEEKDNIVENVVETLFATRPVDTLDSSISEVANEIRTVTPADDTFEDDPDTKYSYLGTIYNGLSAVLVAAAAHRDENPIVYKMN